MTALICFPAIDIRDGKCVRLLRGEFSEETIYGDPLEVARTYAAAGASWIHVVDLDAARTGVPYNRDVVLGLLSQSEVQIEVGGGIRDGDVAKLYLGSGADRVVLGTAALESPDLVEDLAARYPGKVALGIDHRRVAHGDAMRSEVAVRGWESSGGTSVEEVLARFSAVELAAVIVTDISRDGAMAGPDIDGYRELLAVTDHPLVASGGVRSPEDLRALAALEHDRRVLLGAIVGRALLDGAMSLEEALSACVR